MAGEAGVHRSSRTAFRDEGTAAAGSVPLFGSGYEAAGDTGFFPWAGGGFGVYLKPWLRADIRLLALPGLDFSGRSNFLPPGSPEPVTGNGYALFAPVTVWLELKSFTRKKLGTLEPHLGMGAGPAWHGRDSMRLAYPGLATPHILTTPGGTRATLALRFLAGVSQPLTDHAWLDLDYCYTRLGDAATAAGEAERYRPTTGEHKIIPIGGTKAGLRSHGLSFAIRYAW